jgi:hypothetical protein
VEQTGLRLAPAPPRYIFYAASDGDMTDGGVTNFCPRQNSYTQFLRDVVPEDLMTPLRFQELLRIFITVVTVVVVVDRETRWRRRRGRDREPWVVSWQ